MTLWQIKLLLRSIGALELNTIQQPALEYPSSMIKRFVNKQGVFKFNGKKIFISKAIGQENIGIQFNTNNSADVFFAHLNIATTDSNFAQKLTEVDLITGLVYNNKIAA